jgi:hypothetical protein
MKPRGTRMAASLRTSDGVSGVFSVTPGEAPKSIESVEPVTWDKPPSGKVVEGAFTVIGELGMTGQIILLNGYQWEALTQAKLETHFYAAILWGGSPLKVVEDAQFFNKRKS